MNETERKNEKEHETNDINEDTHDEEKAVYIGEPTSLTGKLRVIANDSTLGMSDEQSNVLFDAALEIECLTSENEQLKKDVESSRNSIRYDTDLW